MLKSSNFVTIKIANSLKQIGYNEPVMACYDKCGMLSTYSENLFKTKKYNNSAYCVSAPLWQEAMEWFRNIYSIDISVNNVISGNGGFQYYFSIIKRKRNLESEMYPISQPSWHDEYDDARLYGISKAIELIQSNINWNTKE
ncbi:MAG: hypothetical protein AABY22_17690 [Nanoarchaeota archaeon]